MRKYILLLLCLITIVSCKSKKEKLIGNWEFVNSINNTQSSAADFDYQAFRSAILFSKENFLLIDGGPLDVFNLKQFFSDTTEKVNTNVYYGNWFLEDNDSIVTLNIKNRRQEASFKLTVKSVDKTNLRFAINTINKNDYNHDNAYNYKRSYKQTSFSESEFMSLDLNSWRIPSNKKESEAMIENRIKESLNFTLQFFKYHNDNDLAINTEYLNPLPMYFASNGVALEKNESWNALFYDENDAEASYEILRKAFRESEKIPIELQKKTIVCQYF